MNKTSFGSRLVSSAARSPGRSSTGPEVWRRFTPISRATMCASVVLPSPGGPNSSTWSRASLRFLAASTKIESCPRIFSCPTYSASDLGRSDRSKACSWGETGAPEMRRSVSMAMRYLTCSGVHPDAQDRGGAFDASVHSHDRGERGADAAELLLVDQASEDLLEARLFDTGDDVLPAVGIQHAFAHALGLVLRIRPAADREEVVDVRGGLHLQHSIDR